MTGTNERQSEMETKLKERFAALPPVVQKAIASTEVSAHLRKLASTHRLHFDQWQTLENEVMMVLLGIEPAEKLAENISEAARVEREAAEKISADVNAMVFAPIRGELEVILSEQEKAEKPTEKNIPQNRSPMYKPGEISSARSDIESDPYREPVE